MAAVTIAGDRAGNLDTSMVLIAFHLVNKKYLLLAAFVLSACNSSSGPTDPDARASESRAVANVGCAFQDIQFCQHMIDKRPILTQFFSPDPNRISDEEKKRARRLLTEEVVDAAANISQCRKVTQESLPLIQGMKINRGDYNLMATSPVTQQSSCYITKADG